MRPHCSKPIDVLSPVLVVVRSPYDSMSSCSLRCLPRHAGGRPLSKDRCPMAQGARKTIETEESSGRQSTALTTAHTPRQCALRD